MKILIVGEGNDIWMKRYIQNVLLEGNHEIFLTISGSDSIYSDFFRDNDVHLINFIRNIPVISRIPLAGSILNYAFVYQKLKRYKFDVIHIHFMALPYIVLACLLKRKTAVLIGSFWGSDLFRVSRVIASLSRRLMGFFDCFTVFTEAMRKKFVDLYSEKYSGKLKMMKFGFSGYDDINAVVKKCSMEKCKEYFGVPAEKTTISIGYNARKEQQHIQVLTELMTAPKEIWKDAVFVFPLTYATATDNKSALINSLVELLDEMQIDYIILESFLTDEEIAMLRVSTDVFIHAQTTDAFSASVQEYVFAGAKVLNPTWIKYDEAVKQCAAGFLEYSSLNELPVLLSSVLSTERNTVLTDTNRLYKLFSWDSVKESWQELYRALAKE